MILNLLLYLIKTENIGRSVYGSPGIDEVNLDLHDGFEILERNLTIPNRTHIKEAHFTSSVINDDDYPWPGHPYKNTCNWTLLSNETINVKNKYKSVDMTQEELYWHPAGAKQFYTTQEEIDQMERVKVRLILSPKRLRHTTPFFLPPGELMTIEISEETVSKNIRIDYNQHTENIWKGGNGEAVSKNRLNELLLEGMRLTKTKCTMGTPYGANLYFHISSAEPIEINITGVIINPFFVYGVHSDTEWNNSLSLFKGPVFSFYTGNIEIVGYSPSIKDSAQRINDCGEWLRSAYQIGQTSAYDYGNNPKFGRSINPPQLTSETFVPAGAAVAITGENNCFFPTSTINTFLKFSSLMGNPWMVVHEMNHLRQNNWGRALNGWGEITNNVINLVIYAQSNEASKSRTIDGASGWPGFANSFTNLNNKDANDLRLYSIMLHYFGIEKMKQFIDDDQYVRYYPRNTYGIAGSEMLRASKVFGRNMRYHYNWEGVTDEKLTNATLKELEKMNLPEFHPVTTAYGSGFLVNDTTGFITQRPFYLPNINQTIDFIETMHSIKEEHFGEFEYVSAEFEENRKRFWVEKSKGKFTRIPFTNITDVEEVIVSYNDTTTGEITRCICHFKETIHSIYDYQYYDLPNGLKIKDAYNLTVGREADAIIPLSNTDVSIPKKSDLSTVDVVKLRIRPPKNASYRFVLKGNGQSQIYISNETLTYNPNIDVVLMTEKAGQWYANNPSDPIYLETTQVYNMAYVMYTTNTKTNGWISYFEGSSSSLKTMDASWYVTEEIPPEDLFYTQYIPQKEKIYEMDLYNDLSFLSNDQSKWNITKYPIGFVFTGVTTSNQGTKNEKTTTELINSAITDDDPTTEFRTNYWNGQIPDFPHIYEIDMGETNEFDSVYLAVSQNTGYFDVYGYLEISVSNTEENLESESSIVWGGYYESLNPAISIGEKTKGRYLRLKFHNNTKTWKDGHKGRTSIREVKVGYQFYTQKVIPITNTKVITKSSKWLETRAGPYYNGKAYIGKPDEEIIYKIPSGQRAFGIIGDYYEGIGYADVYLDGSKIGEIHQSVTPQIDSRKLKYSTRAYRSVLFYHLLDTTSEHEVKVYVTQGSITVSGFLKDEIVYNYFTDPTRSYMYTLGDIHKQKEFVPEDSDPNYTFSYEHQRYSVRIEIGTNTTKEAKFYYSYIDDVNRINEINETTKEFQEDFPIDLYLYVQYQNNEVELIEHIFTGMTSNHVEYVINYTPPPEVTTEVQSEVASNVSEINESDIINENSDTIFKDINDDDGANQDDKGKDGSLSGAAIAGIAIAVVAAIAIAIVSVVVIMRRKKSQMAHSEPTT
ncbi:Immuno-dominant variable surface antigen-like [Histomonas meleagridis]|uniref:Immuno-dominant variable surface antigen-like n=1 Tax=Histomonas meleagridis TaxID=135588 RepID=UPI00355A1DCB|nr:Immuno-dominant variable surface antigen-like [Histomonas meleagridis]KAH0800295.1 Immuno-dominant variable surface antigen-like [Histomonas meleagridis]